MDCSPPGSPVHGIFQVRILEWVAMPSSRGSSQPRDRTHISCIAGRFFTHWSYKVKVKSLRLHVGAQSGQTLRDLVDCSPLGFSIHGILQARILSGLPVPSPGHLPDPGIEPRSPTLQADALTSEPQGILCCYCCVASVVSDSVRPHRRQPTRLPRPWDSPGKNTGVGCHILLQCVKVKSLSRVWLLATAWTAAYQAPPSMGFSRQEDWSGVPLPRKGV